MKKSIVTDMKILKQKSLPATPDEIQAILQDLNDTLDLKRGIGLSAVQIGILKNIAIVRYDNIKIDLINAYIIDKQDKFRMVGEGCLSLPSLKIDTRRYREIKINNNNGKEENYNGILAVIVYHELRHTQGFTILDDKWKAR